MGGGLAFLNKKGWHPGSLRNQEKVWAREQERDSESRRLDELKEQIEQERAQEEMRGLAKKAGIKQNGNSMDWMYQGSMRAREEADQRVVTADSTAAAPAGVQVQQEVPVQLPAFLTEDTPASANEVWLRLHSDPLFAIKQQEIAARKSVMANPVQMDAIKLQATKQQASLVEQQQQKAEPKRAKKDAKAAKKAKKQARKAQAADSDSDSEEQPAKVRRIEGPAAANGTAEPLRDDNAHGGTANGETRQFRRDRQEPRQSDRDDRSRAEDHSRDADRSRYDERRHDAHGSERPRYDSRSRGREEHAERYSHRARATEAAALHGGGRGRRADAVSDRDQPHRHHSRENGAEASRGERKGDYGLRMSGAAPQSMAELDRSAAVDATRAALEKAAAAREEEERLKASQRYVKKEYKTGQMTDKDRAQRLAEMTGNASVHEEARWQRLANARKKDQQGEDAPPQPDGADGRAPGTQQQDFVRTAAKDLYGSGEGGSVQDQIGRRKYYSERSSDKAAFRR